MNIFSDIDGTFLDEEGAMPFSAEELADIRSRHRVVFVSSRTREEIVALQLETGLAGWAVAEDGCVLVAPGGASEILGLGRDALLARLRAAGAGTDLEALLASEPVQEDRQASLLLPRGAGEAPEWAGFRQVAASADVRCSIGGRWTTFTAGPDKGEAVMILCDRLGWRPDVGIGNDANDISLLRVVERAYAIGNPGGRRSPLAGLPGVTMLQASGPAGWKEMLRAL